MDFDTVYLLVLSFKPVGFFRFTPNRRYLLMACVRVSQAMDIKKHKNVCVCICSMSSHPVRLSYRFSVFVFKYLYCILMGRIAITAAYITVIT